MLIPDSVSPIPIVPLPEGLSCDTKVTGCEGGILSMTRVPDEPFEAVAGPFGEAEKFRLSPQRLASSNNTRGTAGTRRYPAFMTAFTIWKRRLDLLITPPILSKFDVQGVTDVSHLLQNLPLA